VSKRTRNLLIWVVTGAWILNFIVTILSHVLAFDFEPSRAINGAFAFIIGSLFVVGRNGNGKENGKEKKDDLNGAV